MAAVLVQGVAASVQDPMDRYAAVEQGAATLAVQVVVQAGVVSVMALAVAVLPEEEPAREHVS